jgi:hypothetical protein
MPVPAQASVFRAAFVFAAKEIPYIGRNSGYRAEISGLI